MRISLDNNNNNSFKGRFLFTGTEKDAKSFLKFMTGVIKESETQPTNISLFRSAEDKYFVTTGSDCDKPFEIEKSLNSSEFYDKTKQNFLPGITFFDPILQCYDKVHSQIKKGIVRYYKTVHFRSAKVDPSERILVSKMDFIKPVGLMEALDKAKPIVGIHSHMFEDYKKAIKLNSKLNNLNVVGVSGVGQESIVFNIDNERVLKLSYNSCYPEKEEEFDLPLIDKGAIPLRTQAIYFYIAPKGSNSNETIFKRCDCEKVLSLMREKGYFLTDIYPSDYKQFVKINGKMYLCDSDCARLEHNESRLFQYQWV